MLDFKNASSSKFFLCNNHGPLQPPKLSANAHSHTLTQIHTLCHSKHEKHGRNGPVYRAWPLCSSFPPSSPPHPKMKNVAILVAFLVFNSSPIFSMKNAAKMASFLCLAFTSLLHPSPSSRHEKYGQLGRIFYVWIPVQSPSHSEHEKCGRNGLVSRAWPLLPSFAFPPTQTKMRPNRLHFLCCSYLVPLPHQSYV